MRSSTTSADAVAPAAHNNSNNNNNNIGDSSSKPRFNLLNRPDFLAGINSFRQNFGVEVRSKIADGYTFLGADRPPPPPPTTSTSAAAKQPNPPTNKYSHTPPSTAIQKPRASVAAAATHLRPSHRPAETAAATATTAHNQQKVNNKDSDSTLDNLLSIMNKNPPPLPNFSLNHNQYHHRKPSKGNSNNKDAATVTADKAHHKKPTTITSEKGMVLTRITIASQALRIPKASATRLFKTMPNHHIVRLSDADQLAAMRTRLDKAEAVTKKHRKENANARPNTPATTTAATNKPAVKDSNGNFGKQPTQPQQLRVKKRPAPLLLSESLLQFPIPKKARRAFVSAMADITKPAKKRSLDDSQDNHLKEVSQLPEKKKLRKSLAAKDTLEKEWSQISSNNHTAATISNSSGSAKPGSRKLSKDNSIADVSGDTTAPNTEHLRKRATRLCELMKTFKYGGDSKLESKSNRGLAIVYYLESLACCLEEFWCRSAFASLEEMSKRWHSMLEICEYLRKRCTAKDLSSLRGCASLVNACVCYQLGTTGLKLFQSSTSTSTDLLGVQKQVEETVKYMEKMGKYESSSRSMLNARTLYKHFPHTWRRCQETPASYGVYEQRSTPFTQKWPDLVYPVGATSNPMDIANFIRQIGREWLDQNGLAMKLPSPNPK